LRPQRQICHEKQTHAGIADIDAKSTQLGGLGEDLHRGIQQLATLAPPVCFEAAFENHPYTREDKVAQ